MRLSIVALFVIAVSATAQPTISSRPTVGVLPLDSETVDEIKRNRLTDVLQSAIVRVERFTVVERERVDEVLNDIESSYNRAMISDVRSIPQLGYMLQAQKLITGKIEQQDSSYQVILRIIDVQTTSIEWSVDEFCLEDELVHTVRDLAERLAAGSATLFRPEYSPKPEPVENVELQWRDIQAIQLDWIANAHAGAVYSLAVHPAGELFASAGSDRTIRIWQYENPDRTCVKEYQSHEAAVTSVAFSRDGRYLISGDELGCVQIRNLTAEGSVAVLLGHSGRVNGIALSENKRSFATASDDSTVRVWSLFTGETLFVIDRLYDRVNSVVFCADDEFIVTGSDDMTLKVWSTRNGDLLRTLIGHTSAVNALASSGRTSVLSGGADNTVRVWDVREGTLIATEPQADAFEILSLETVKGSEYYFAGTLTGKVHVDRINDSRCLQDYRVGDEAVRALAFDPVSLRMITGDDQTGVIRVWRVDVR